VRDDRRTRNPERPGHPLAASRLTHEIAPHQPSTEQEYRCGKPYDNDLHSESHGWAPTKGKDMVGWDGIESRTPGCSVRLDTLTFTCQFGSSTRRHAYRLIDAGHDSEEYTRGQAAHEDARQGLFFDP